MSFVHDDPEFDALLQIVADQRGLGVALVEKDYWVTHCCSPRSATARSPRTFVTPGARSPAMSPGGGRS
jgi:hypothetical protein